MKPLSALFPLVLTLPVFANEDHLLMIPTPIQGSESIYIVNRPMISGYGADFEGYCHRIAEPYLGDVRSPSSKIMEQDMNPASLAKIQLSAVLPDESGIYKVTIDYTKATEDSKKNAELLRAILTCLYKFGDSLHFKLDLKVSFDLVGIDPKSNLHTELAQFVERRKQHIEKARAAGDADRPDRPEFEWSSN